MIRWIFSGWQTPAKVSPLEGFLSRLLFAMLLLFTMRSRVEFTGEPHPVGLLRLLHGIDDQRTWLTWLADPAAWEVYSNIFALLLVVYVAGMSLPLVLPVLAVMHVLPFTLFNSQGYTHHGYQIVSCTLIIQACAVIYYSLRRKFTLLPPDEKLRSWLLVHSQVIVTGMYFISVFTKMDNSGGMWLWNSNNVALDMIKTARQSYLNALDPAFLGNPPEALWMLEHPWLSRAFFGGGMLLELLCIIGIGHRALAFLTGVALIVMHRCIDRLMGGVSFINNELLCFIFMINLPFLIAWPLNQLKRPMLSTAAVAGALLGVIASYWLQPEGYRMAAGLKQYLLTLINSMGIWNSLEAREWREFFQFSRPAFFSMAAGGLAGGIAGGLLEMVWKKREKATVAPGSVR